MESPPVPDDPSDVGSEGRSVGHPKQEPGRIRVERGEILESEHQVHAVVADRTSVHALFGRRGDWTTLRSAAKLFQALPLVEDGVEEELGLTKAELAVCCASHNSEARHVAAARAILTKAGVAESALACGGHRPLDEEVARGMDRSGTVPGPIHNNCSGKHAGMVALAMHHGWPVEGYHAADHPVQRRMRGEISRWSGVEESDLPVGIDGCGIPCFAVPLERMAIAFRDFGRQAAGDGGAARILGAVAAEPGMIAGRGRLCSELADATDGRVIAKIGAEGVYGAVIASEGIGIAVKVQDGSRRAVELALMGVLDRIDGISAAERIALGGYRRPVVTNTRGEAVGSLRFEAS